MIFHEEGEALSMCERLYKAGAVELHLIESADAPVVDTESLRTAAIDFLTDFMHLCDVSGIEFEPVLKMCRVHFSAEAGRKLK